jgi:protease-4
MTKSGKWFLGILGFLALVVVGISLLFYAFLAAPAERTEIVAGGSGDRIAVVELEGEIISTEGLVRQLKKHRESRSIKGIVVRVNSPGGGVVPSQELYEEVKKTRDSGKPVVVSMGSLAASGGYYVSCGGSRIVANPGTLTGSIGVISEFLQLQDALGKLGVGVKTIKSGTLKDAGSPVRKMTEEDRRYFQELMDDVHQQFIRVVETARKLPHEKVVALADGRVYTGVRALELGLVDTLGTYEDAIRIAAQLSGIRGEPTVVKERKRQSLWETLLGDAAQSVSDLKQEIFQRPVLSYKFVGPY